MLKTQFIRGLTLAVALPLLLSITAWGQQEDYEPSELRSSFEERRKSNLDANNLRATYYNFGYAGSVSGAPDEIIFEYPKNTGRQYMYLMAIFAGAEVTNQQDGSTMHIVDSPSYRTSEGENWNFNPIEGYAADDTDELARSDMPETWPDSWPDKEDDPNDPGWSGSWPGYFGKNIFNADQEFYYKAGDDLYTRFIDDGTFYPDSTDPSRGGLALLVDGRIMAWTQILISDVNFSIFEIQNDGSFNYDKVGFSLWIADWVGTPQDDRPIFDQRRATAFLTDENRTSSPPEFDGEPIGMLSMKFLETPGNAEDGIDNDGDADEYDPASLVYNPSYPNLFDDLTEDGGGFHNSLPAVRDSVVPKFEDEDFQVRNIGPGDKLVLIGPNRERIVTTYPQGGGTVTTMDSTITLPAGGLNVREDSTFALRSDLFDNDLDGLIDENQPNHKDKFTNVQGNYQKLPVRYINYLYFESGDTLQRGLVVPNEDIRRRIQNDPDFAELVEEHDGRYRNRHTSAPMIDEARDDFFDNDQDWVAASSDVGIDGTPETGDEGEGDMIPTSGAFTNLPGEPNIDKTDVSETDLIGITTVTFPGAGTLGNGSNFARDEQFWNENLVPGYFEFTDPGFQPAEDSDILISSSFFPLNRGSIERFAVAVAAANGAEGGRIHTANGPNLSHPDYQTNLDRLNEANNAYEADYQFATAPKLPTLKVVPGDGQVTLYWDREAEESFDRYVDLLGFDGNDFEGYKVYRATDPAFLDAKQITDGMGNLQFNKWIAQFDLDNQHSDYHPVDINGTKFYLGENSGIQRKYVDNEVINGRRYYYAVTSYDFGVEAAGIAPSESSIQINLNPDGTVELGRNVAVTRPTAAAAGYITADNPQAELVQGTPGGDVFVNIIDPDSLRPDNRYRVVFQDTIIPGGSGVPDTTKTKNFSLLNVTGNTPDTLIKKSPSVNGGDVPVRDGFRMTLENRESLRLNRELSGWQVTDDDTVHDYRFQPFTTKTKVSDYRLIIGEDGFNTSKDTSITIAGFTIDVPGKDVNFKVENTTRGEELEFAFLEFDGSDGRFTAQDNPTGFVSDQIVLIEEYGGEENQYTWQFTLFPVGNTTNPEEGDTLEIRTVKPFTDFDIFEFTIGEENIPEVNSDSAKSQLSDIRVVPNPYLVTHKLEPRPTTAQPQQTRGLHFQNLPSNCTIRIFDISGRLVDKIEVRNGIADGTYIWDMLTKDDLELAYGIYLYHVKAPGIGEKTGKFAVIK